MHPGINIHACPDPFQPFVLLLAGVHSSRCSLLGFGNATIMIYTKIVQFHCCGHDPHCVTHIVLQWSPEDSPTILQYAKCFRNVNTIRRLKETKPILIKWRRRARERDNDVICYGLRFMFRYPEPFGQLLRFQKRVQS